jgi:glyoxylase-like metal-dependent hydrolase (beta-lactamase superfamily II)
MNNPTILTIDLNFLGRSGTIGVYLVHHAKGAILIETGPGSTIQNLVTGLQKYAISVEGITDVFLTHIHLDHAGAAGWFAQHGCQIHVHENGAPHLVNPEKLLASASRLYGDRMEMLWGEFLPVPEGKISIMHNNEQIIVGDIAIQALDVPGHANHHLAYLIGDAVFTGDITGIRLTPQKYLSLPMPPPDLYLEKWRTSIKFIQQCNPGRIIPTHFGVYSDAAWYLQAVLDALDEVEEWMDKTMPQNLSIEELRRQYIEFEHLRAGKYQIDKSIFDTQQIANPSFMSADGLLRYWKKFRQPS